MLIYSRKGWALSEAAATPEHVFLTRRNLISMAVLPVMASAIPFPRGSAHAQTAVPRNPRYTLDRPVTDEALVTSYNNFMEFGSHKTIAKAAQKLPARPWTVTIDGLVARSRTVDIDTLITAMPVEERLYRHRCVETWAMAVPWRGFAMKALLDYAEPLSSARYVAFQSFHEPRIATGQKQFWYPWPYVEGLGIAEAANELSFMSIGAYGKPLPAQNGAPLRMTIPWKYGFKSGKSIVRITFTDQRPQSFWSTVQGDEYGFWANVNPAVPHKRWSQTTERLLGSDERRPTLIFNGYGEHVAHLYKGLEGEPLYM